MTRVEEDEVELRREEERGVGVPERMERRMVEEKISGKRGEAFITEKGLKIMQYYALEKA